MTDPVAVVQAPYEAVGRGETGGAGHVAARCPSSGALPPGQQTLSPICAAGYPRNSATSVAPARTTTT
jgi:hypothetical protein